MSADANSAYGKPWFRQATNPQEAALNADAAAQQLQSTQNLQPTTAPHSAHRVAHSGAVRAVVSPKAAASAPAATRSYEARPYPVQDMGEYASIAQPHSSAINSLRADNTVQVGTAEAPWANAQPAVQLPGILAGLQERMQQTLSDQVTPLRLASHLSVLLVAAAVLLFSRIEIPEWDFQLVAMPEEQTQSRQFRSVTEQVSALLAQPTLSATSASAEALQVQIVPFTIIPERTRKEIQVYSVQSGDTVLGIAAKFKVQPETLLWSNPALENNPDLLRINDQLRILPVDGVLHTVKAGDTLSALASTYKVDAAQIVAYESNNLEDVSSPLIIGTDIVVPGGSKPYITRQVTGMGLTEVPVPAGAAGGSGNFGWPASGSISQNYWGGHQALDIAGREGAPVKASDGGFVTIAGGGWNGGYGNHVVIDHGNGFVTLYAHLNSIFVKAGETVSAGQQIGTVGNTGNSTGPHLHFEIRYQGYPRNPYNYLP